MNYLETLILAQENNKKMLAAKVTGILTLCLDGFAGFSEKKLQKIVYRSNSIQLLFFNIQFGVFNIIKCNELGYRAYIHSLAKNVQDEIHFYELVLHEQENLMKELNSFGW